MLKKDISDGQTAFENEFDDKFKIIETSKEALMAGDIISFNYNGSQRFGLVVKSRRTGVNGTFLSTRNNNLLNIFLLNSIKNSDCRLIINTLYRDRIRATYKNTPAILSAFLGKENFRTFNTDYSKMSDIRMYMVEKENREKTEEDEIEELEP